MNSRPSGAWAIGGGSWAFIWGLQDDNASIAAMCDAVDSAVGTAAVYGLGHSEGVAGALLKSLPGAERPMVFTKRGRTGVDPP